MRFNYVLYAIMFLALAITNAYGQVITISVPDSLVDAGDELVIPVSVTEITAEDGVFSGEWRFNRSSSLITFTGYSTEGTLLDGEFTQFNATNGEFAFASGAPLTGEGTLMYLHIKVRDDAVKFQQSQISISSAMFNEGEPAVNTQSGTISVRGISISPREPSGTFVEGQSFQFNLTGNVVPPVSWSSSADSVATVDSNGLVQGISPGSVRIFAVDADGLSDSTSIFRVNPESILDLTVGVSSTSATQTLEGSVQVNVSDVTGLNITSGQFDLNYNATRIEILSITTEETILEGRPAPTVFIDGSTIKVAFADATPLEGEGALINVNFRVFRNATGSFNVTPQNVLFNENITAQTSSGTITIINAPAILVDQPEPEFTIGETMNFSVLSGGNAPYRWESDNEAVAVIDENTGVATALSRGVTNIIAIDDDNFESEPMELRVNDVTASIPDFITENYDQFELPLQVTDLTGLGITSYEVNISYDESVLIFDQVITSGTLSDGLSIFSSADDGVIRIAVASTTPIEGEGELFKLLFSFNETTALDTDTHVGVSRVQFNEPGPLTPTATRRGGEVTLSSGQLPDQVILISPENNALNVPLQPQLSWEETDPDHTYTLEFAHDAEFNSPLFQLNFITETVYTLNNELNPNTQYFWRVRANSEAGNGPYSEIRSLTTVPPPAEAPVLSSPDDEAVDVSRTPVLRWFSSGFSDTYLVELATDDLFENEILSESVADTFLTTPTLSFETTYYWRVTGENVNGAGGTSDVFSFTTVIQPVIPEIDATASTVTATSPHFATGTDSSTVTVVVVDTEGDPMSGFTDNDFLITLSGSAQRGTVTETATAGTYRFAVANSAAEIITVTVRVDDVELDDQPEIIFEAPEVPGVDAVNSTVTATSPHFATGTDSSTVTVVVVDTEGDPMTGFGDDDFMITLSGSAQRGTITETATAGTYRFAVANTVPENVLIVVEVDNTELSSTPTIVFETAPPPPPPTVQQISLAPVESGLETTWQISEEEFTGTFNIYRGSSQNQLGIITSVSGTARNFIDTNAPQGSLFYAVSAVNEEGVEGDLSNILSFVLQTVQATTDWQLISLPVQTDSVEAELATLFKFNSGYSIAEKLAPSYGYWIKTKSFETEQYPVNGSGLDTLTVSLNTGWNLIGSVSDSIHRSLIDDPDNILSSAPVYTYNNGEYQESMFIVPQYGHWIHATQPGTISLDINSEAVVIADEISEKSLSRNHNDFSKLKFTSDGFSSHLLIADEPLTDHQRNSFLLPPIAPDPQLDVRLANQTRVVDSAGTAIRLIAKNYPVQVELADENTESPYAYRIIMKNDGDERSVDLIPGRVQIIDKEYDSIELVRIQSDEIVSEHRLMPNYPNPFNPTTTLHYYLSENANVSLEVFDMLGRKVSELYSGPQLSGEYKIQFDASNLASGVYIVRFRAGSHVDIRRISLIK